MPRMPALTCAPAISGRGANECLCAGLAMPLTAVAGFSSHLSWASWLR
jgi:hypothetical protein